MNNIDLLERVETLENENKFLSKKSEIVSLITQYSHISRNHGGEVIRIITNEKDLGGWRHRNLVVRGTKIMRIRTDENDDHTILSDEYCDIADIKIIWLGNTKYEWED